MNKAKLISAASIIVIVSALFYFGGGILASRSGSRSTFSERVPWKGAVPVALREGTPAEMFLRAAGAAEYDRISSLDTQLVPVFSFEGMKEVPAASLASLYDELDPLYDPFLKKLPSLFHGQIESSPAEIVYILTDDGPNSVARRLEAHDDGIEGMYQVVGIGRDSPHILPPLLLVLLLFMLPSLSISGRLLFLAGSLPLFIISLSGHFAYYPAAMLFPLFWRNLAVHITHVVAERMKRRADDGNQLQALYRSLILYAFFTIATLFFSILTADGSAIRSGLILGAAVLAAPALGCAFAAFEFLRSIFRQHPRFVPVSMKNHAAAGAVMRGLFLGSFGRIAMITICTGLLALGLSMERMPEQPVRLPLPVDYENPSEGFFLSSEEEILPSPGDFFAHRAFHEGYLYGMTYRIPFPGETLDYSDYHYIDGILYSEPVIARQFTEQWYEAIMSRQAKNGVIGLLLDRKTGTVRYGTTDIYEETDRAGWNMFVLLIFVAILTLTAETGIPVSPGRIVSESRTVRRKEQAA